MYALLRGFAVLRCKALKESALRIWFAYAAQEMQCTGMVRIVAPSRNGNRSVGEGRYPQPFGAACGFGRSIVVQASAIACTHFTSHLQVALPPPILHELLPPSCPSRI